MPVRNLKNRSLVAFFTIALVAALGPVSGCSSATTDSAEPTGTTDEAVTAGSINTCALGYFRSVGFRGQKTVIQPFLTLSPASLFTPHPVGYWTGTFAFPGRPWQEFYVDSDSVANNGNCSHANARRRPRNPPGGSGETRAQCHGCYWTPVHTSHPHGPCTNHRHKICKNWNAAKGTCHHNATGDFECM